MEPEPTKGCLDCLMDELKPENVAPIHDKSRLFVDSQWTIGRMSTAYVVYRVVVSILLIIWLITDFLDEAGHFYRHNYAIWFVFATNWSFLALCLEAAWMATTSVYYYYHTRHQYLEFPKPIGHGLRGQWIIYSIATNSAVVVTISFWSFIIIYVENDLSRFMMTPMSQLKHSLSTIYVVIDLLINAVPVRVYHVIYPLLFGLVYTVFNVVYFVSDGRGPNGHPYAYDIMDWRHPLGSTVTVLLGFVLTIVVQFLLYALYCIRLAAHRRLAALMAPDAAVRYRPSTSTLTDADETAAAAATNSLDESGPIFLNDTRGRSNAGYNAIDRAESEFTGR